MVMAAYGSTLVRPVGAAQAARPRQGAASGRQPQELLMPSDPNVDCVPIIVEALNDGNVWLRPRSNQPDGSIPCGTTGTLVNIEAPKLEIMPGEWLKTTRPADVDNPLEWDSRSQRSLRRHINWRACRGAELLNIVHHGLNAAGVYNTALETESTAVLGNCEGFKVTNITGRYIWGDVVQVVATGAYPDRYSADFEINGVTGRSYGRMLVAINSGLDWILRGLVTEDMGNRSLVDIEPTARADSNNQFKETKRGRITNEDPANPGQALPNVVWTNWMLFANNGGGDVGDIRVDHFNFKTESRHVFRTNGRADNSWAKRSRIEIDHIKVALLQYASMGGASYIRDWFRVHDNDITYWTGHPDSVGVALKGGNEGVEIDNNRFINAGDVYRSEDPPSVFAHAPTGNVLI